ncbi:hypothetical protein O3P69_003521 [Scylla paramamosain]|uniref:Trafficking protein particle complex subunit 8 n=1 Tax=Scylla paramamosain TaxID=85552 RepID=A0AAW0UJ20_SCYPA
MAQCKLSPHEYIQNAFSPQVAILCSEDADNLCLKNNLRFVELIQPFCRLNSEIRIADPAGNTVPIRNLRVVFEDMNRRPPQPTLGKKLLSEVVSSTPWDRPVTRTIGASGTREALELELQQTTPWFETWRDTFLHVQYPSDHEFTKHYIACIVVVASTSDNPMDQLNRLSQYLHQQLHQTPARFPKWFSPNILKFFVLLHDVSAGDLSRSEQIFEHMGTTFGSNNCHLLQINSRETDQSDVHLPDPWSQFLLQRAACDLSGASSSETSSGTGTPREDVSGLPSRVSEGDTTDNTEPIHPLSPTLPPVDEKNGTYDMMPGVEISSDVPVMVNRPNMLVGTAQHHGGCLTSSDVDRIRIFIHEFCVRSLIPHVEKQIRYLNEVVTNRSRSKSLLSATRRWLVGNKSPGSATNSVIYSSEATELQTRRLGDLCFMFGLYEVAYSYYHTAKNDFKSDQAWLYFAGAQEMAALAAFMQNSSDYPKRYLENSLQTYLNVCKVYNFAIRSTLLSTEVLKHCGEFGEAAMMFIKLTSEESDLLSALMLEQAAHCFINSQRPLPRKYAFHMTLAGHRFSKAGQRSHSLRAYKQAFQVYAAHGWVLAEDHIHFTLGKQAHHLKQLTEGLDAYTNLVDQKLKKNASSQQSPSQQITYIREFINIFHQYTEQEWNSSNGAPSFEVELLFYYDTAGVVGKKKYRLLRHHSSIYLERSLSLKVSSAVSQNLQDSLKNSEDIPGSCSYTSNLHVEVFNNSEVDSSCSSYTVVGISGNSKHWAVVPHSTLQGQTLKAGESCHLCVKCVQYLNPDPSNLVLSQLQFNNSQGPLNSWWRFSLRERITLLDLLADPPPPNPTADHIPPPPTQDQMDANHINAANTLDMVVTAIWKGERGGHETWGQHSVHLKSLGDSISFPVSSISQAGEEEKPPVRIIPETPVQLIPTILPPASKQKHMVKVSAHFPCSMDHDFITNRLCCLEFELYLHNCSACHLNTFLNLAPEAFPGSSGSSSQMYSPQASTQLLHLEPMGLTTHDSASIIEKGCYPRQRYSKLW